MYTGRSGKVLFVDDEPSVLMALVRASRVFEFDVDCASSAEDALSKLRSSTFDVVVSDYLMPGGMNGVALLECVRVHWPEASRVLVTGYADEEAFEKAINVAGVTRFLRKPWVPSGLRTVVEQAFDEARLRKDHRKLLDRLQGHNKRLSKQNDFLSEQVMEASQEVSVVVHRWNTALGAVSDPMTIVDREMRLVIVNKAARRLGRSSQIEGQICHQALFGRESRCVSCPIADQETVTLTTSSMSKEGQSFQVRAYALEDGSGAHLCLYHDVTREEKLERHADHLDRMAAMGRLMGSIAHEINNPLHAILSFIQLAEKRKTDDEKLARYHEVIREAAIRCRDTIRSMRDLSRNARPQDFGRMDASSLLDHATVLFRGMDSVELTVENKVPPQTFCEGSSTQLQQVIVNLVQNACDAAGMHGVVVVKSAVVDHSIWISVSDNGDGISPAVQDAIFEPFFTTKPEGQGTGLGLSISRRIVQLHRGALSVTRSELGGARFDVRIPCCVEVEEAMA